MPEDAPIPTASATPARISRRAKYAAVASALVLAFLVLLYNRHAIADLFTSEFDEVSMEGRRFLEKGSERPFSGTLQLRGAEILEVGQALFGGTPLESWVHADAAGLLVELEVKDGEASGGATVFADLRSTSIAEHLPRSASGVSFTLAKWFAPRRTIANAQLRAGKLHGKARVWKPSASDLRKFVEVEFAANQPHGKAIQFHPNGKVYRDVTFVQGRESGLFKEYYLSGEIESVAEYIGGVRQGISEEYFLDGNVRSKSVYDDGELVARSEFFPSGQKQRELTYSYGEVSYLLEWYSDGTPATQPQNGLLRTYHKNGALHSERTYVNGVGSGEFKVFYANGRLWEHGFIAYGVLDGSHKKWWNNGKKAVEETWRHGRLHGELRRWYDNGKVWERAQYLDGIQTGSYEKFWKNGKRAHQYEYVQGAIHGSYKLFHDNGKPWKEGAYRHGRLTGGFRTWYRNGTPRLQANYVDGRLDGEFKNWLADGSAYEMATYGAGRKLESTRP